MKEVPKVEVLLHAEPRAGKAVAVPRDLSRCAFQSLGCSTRRFASGLSDAMGVVRSGLNQPLNASGG